MTTWRELGPALARGEKLTYNQSRAIMSKIMSGEFGEVELASFLSILAFRGVDVTELRGLADEMQDRAEAISLPQNVVDIVGTGGDGANTVNISTMAAIVIAGAGVPVVKHGNRASTSASGSADVLEALGVNLAVGPTRIVDAFDKAGIAFLFANLFHPSMRHAAHVRRTLGFPTAFNVLGPLTNPARPDASAVGVARADAAPLVAGVFAERGSSAFVFRGAEVGLDELTTVENAQIWVVQRGRVSKRTVSLTNLLDLQPARLEALRGGDPADNAASARRVFAGEEGPVADAVALNAAIGLMAGLAGKDADQTGPNWHDLETFDEGLQVCFTRARNALKSGGAARTLSAWVEATN